jgi:hypothetical protein
VKIGTILEQIDLGKMALPEFQRGYVWNREQVRGMMDSLYRRHPVGGLLIWETNVDNAATRGEAAVPTGGWVDLLLDGQQRITALYGIMRGRPLRFFDGNAATFTGLHFTLAEETFEFYAPLKMKGNPAWVDVSKLMQTADVAEILEPIEGRGRASVRGLRFKVTHAVATWLDGDAVELLAITHWREEGTVPIRLLCPDDVGPPPQGNEHALHARLPADCAPQVVRRLVDAFNRA